jgi:hypothetical protein
VPQVQIKHRFTGAVLFECDAPESGFAIRHALERATKERAYLRDADLRGADLRDADLSDADLRDADLRDADLSGADLSGADLRGAYLRDADLRGADLRDADLSGADLRGAYLRGAYLRDADLSGADLRGAERASDEAAIANLDKVREIILDDAKRLEMRHWHDDNSQWRDKTCAEEMLCGTTHCLAGWLQVCATDDAVRSMETQIAGIVQAPVAAKMFFRGSDEVIDWLRDRKYVAEIEEGNRRAAERKAAKEAA